MLKFLFLSIVLFFTSCQSTHLRVRTEYIDESYLASSEIENPYISSPCFCGEQLVIRYCGLSAPGYIKLSVRFSDHEVKSFIYEVRASRGYSIYRLINEEYLCKGPFLSYKVELFEQESCIATFSHLWAEPIDL